MLVPLYCELYESDIMLNLKTVQDVVITDYY